MPKFDESSNRSGNELGEFLPEDDAQLCEECELIQACNMPQARRRCKQVADAYGGIGSKAVRIDEGLFNCKFKVWRQP
jgi:hypothetical protein